MENTKSVSQPVAILSSKKVGRFLELMRERMDDIIIDSSPCTMFQDAAVLSEYADEILYVVKCDRLPAEGGTKGNHTYAALRAVV